MAPPNDDGASEAIDSRLDALLESFWDRARRGDRPSISEYIRRNPEAAEKIRLLFPALELLETIGTSGPRSEAAGDAASAGATSNAAAGRRLGEYRLVREVGRGGMGVVYEAEQVNLGRRVALKVLPFHSLMDERNLERFRREARAAANLQHPNIVPVYGLHEEGGVHYYVMQYVEGQGLDTVLLEVKRLSSTGGGENKDDLGPDGVRTVSSITLGLLTDHFEGSESGFRETRGSPREVGQPDERHPLPASLRRGALPAEYFHGTARLGLQAAQALAHAHEKGVLHRDIKPSNLLVDTKGTVWVTDFGLSKTEEAGDLTRSGELVGTLRYMAPERFTGQSDLRSDVYSLGLTIYELLTLRPAFAAGDRAQLLRDVAAASPARPRSIAPRIPRALEAIALKALSKDPADRYQTSTQLAEDLERFLEGKPVLARTPLPGHGILRTVRRHPLGTALAFAAALLLAAGIAWWSRPYRPIKPSDLVVSDLDGDRDLDLAVLNTREFEDPEPGSISIFPNRGGGAFGGPIRIPAREFPLSLAARDLDGDADIDLAVANQKSMCIGVLRNEGNGAYAPLADLALDNYTMRMAASDLDGDSDVDLAALVVRSNQVHVFKNRGDGSFAERASFGTGAGPDYVLAAELSGDGVVDLVTSNIVGKSLSVLVNRGDATFQSARDYAAGEHTQEATAADLDADGDADLAVTFYGAPGLAVLANKDGTFADAVPYSLPFLVQTLAPGDFDQDGNVDLAAAGDASYVCRLRNLGGGKLSAPEILPAAEKPAVIRAGDIDGDGDLDLAVTSWGRILILLNDGKGGFERSAWLALDSWAPW